MFDTEFKFNPLTSGINWAEGYKIDRNIDFNVLYEMSSCHDITLVKRNGKLELYIDRSFECMPTHNNIQNNLSDVESIQYIKYLSRHQHRGLYLTTMPDVDVIKYNNPWNESFLNFPSIIHRNITVYNGNKGLYLTPQLWSEYVNIQPKFLADHRYISIVDDKIKINYFKYYIENDDGSSSEYFYIKNRKLKIIKKECSDLDEGCCPFIEKAVNNMLDEFDSVHYTLPNYENFNDRLDSIIRVVGLDKKIKMTINP